MIPPTGDPKSRRQFLKLLAASPVLPYVKLPHFMMQALQQEQEPVSNPYTINDVLHVQDPDGIDPSVLNSFQKYEDNLTSASQAVTVFDLEAVARRKLNNPGHIAFLMAYEDGATYMANREGFNRWQLRPRRLVDTRHIDTSVKLFGTTWNNPVILCPVGGQAVGGYPPEAEVAVARAAKVKGALQVLSSNTSRSVEDVAAARGGPVWYQLYQHPEWNRTLGTIKRAEAAGCPALVWTIDGGEGSGEREALVRVRRANLQYCGSCHTLLKNEGLTREAIGGGGFQNAGVGPMTNTPPFGPSKIVDDVFTWDYVKRLKDATPMKLLLKGIVTAEDAALAVHYGADGIWISNHGGRKENSGRGTIECLPEIVAAVGGRCPIIIDSGFRRGEDIYKALALGATAIGVGRPYVWGLKAFGQEGVEAALDILNTEFRRVMGQMGATSIKGISRRSVIAHRA